MKIAITGATGFVGTHLVKKLAKQGHHLIILTRSSAKANQQFPASSFPNLEIIKYTPTESGKWQEKISGCDGVINLAGEPIAEKRWSEAHKQVLLNSRKIGTEKVVESIKNAPQKPVFLINFSAIGYYGTSETATFDENSHSGNDFLAHICENWEEEANKVKEFGTRLVIIRSGIVLGNGGALAKMLPAFNLFAGGKIGSGKQWFSWIHIEDLVNLIIEGINRSDMTGVFNGTSPNPVTMDQLCTTLGSILNRPSWLPVPSFVLQLLLGDGAKVVLEGQKVLPNHTLSIGFNYEYPELKEALTNIINS
jgi:uncharacterized protein